MKTLLSAILIIILLATIVGAQEPAERLPKNVSVEVQIVAIPRASALPLIPELMNPLTIDGAYARIQELLIAGTAKLIGWPISSGISGQLCTVESINEFRYATQFDDAGVHVYFAESKAAFGPTTYAEQPSKIEGIQLNAVPANFETRNVGVSLQVEPVLSADEETISLNLNTQHTWLKGMRKVTVERDKTKETLTVEQPDFEVNSVTTSLTLKSGQRTFLGTFAAAEPDHLELFLLKAERRD